MKKLLLTGLLLLSLAATAQATSLVSGLGGVAGYGENKLINQDDVSTGLLDLSTVFTGGLNFFGTTYTGLYINSNGNVTFDKSILTITPFDLTNNTNNAIIAPYFGDVDTTYAGNIFWDLDTANNIFSVTWDSVGYYQGNRFPTNSFQLRLTDMGSGDFDIEFRYESIGWTAGDETPNIHARAGYNSGNGVDFYELAASGDRLAMLDIVNSSNVGVAGLFQWEVRSGNVLTGSGVDNSGSTGTGTGAAPAPVPEPSTLLLLGSGIAGVGLLGRRLRPFRA